jgi:hypothetical protein
MGVIENAKDIADLIKKVGDVELYRKINALEGEIIDLTREKRQAEQRVELLEEKLKYKTELTFKEPFWFAPNDRTPYCAACWELKTGTVHLVLRWTSNGQSSWECPVCKCRYGVPAGIYGTQTNQ